MTVPYLLLFLFIAKLNAQQTDGIVCSINMCPDYIDKNPCRELPKECQIQNETYSGTMLPSPDACNCCPYCLINLKEGDPCTVGGITGGIPDSICGPGLTCEDSNCIKMIEAKVKLPCIEEQALYDQKRNDGTLGILEVRPECDSEGFYPSYKCILGQMCFCIDKFGDRIFGEISYTTEAKSILKCECSRKYYEVLKFFDEDLNPNQYFRCTPNGDYDPIQCIGDGCFCADFQDGAPTFPTAEDVKISNISKKTLPDCFDEKIHLTGSYYYDCADKYLKILEEINDYKTKDGYDEVFEIEFPNCDINGGYAPVQKSTYLDESNTEQIYYYCSNIDGTPMGDYRSKGEEKINCNCARALALMPESNPEKPECCTNGNFNRVQCRRGTCYCVDDDGYQAQKHYDDVDKKNEVSIDDLENLFCYLKEDQEKCHDVPDLL